MHMYGGRESLKRDCHGHYFFSSNVKLTQDRCGLIIYKIDVFSMITINYDYFLSERTYL